MIFNSDSFYEIGNGHNFCQDYSLHGSLGNYRWGIVSDGCSGSRFTDVGARLLVRKADAIIRYHIQNGLGNLLNFYSDGTLAQMFLNSIMCDVYGIGCLSIIRSFLLEDSVLDATLWLVIGKKVLKDNGEVEYIFSVLGWGDGQVIINNKGLITIEYISYPSGAPFYPSYHFNQDREKSYVDSFNVLCKKGFISISNDGKVIQTEEDKLYRTMYVAGGVSADSVTVTTDGFRTYNFPQSQDVLRLASTRLIDFKSYEGVFLQRRMKALARRDTKENIGHFDDIAAASVLMMEEPKESTDTMV